MKKIIITMLVALLVIATTQAKPVVKVTPKKHATEQVVDQNDAAQDEVAQDEAVEEARALLEMLGMPFEK